jgi:hypothetical protein
LPASGSLSFFAMRVRVRLVFAAKVGKTWLRSG